MKNITKNMGNNNIYNHTYPPPRISTQGIDAYIYEQNNIGKIMHCKNFVFDVIKEVLNIYVTNAGNANKIYSGRWAGLGVVFSFAIISYFAPYHQTIFSRYIW